METANLISQLLGNKTATQISYNKPKYLDLNPGSRSLHLSETQRALLLPQEVIQLPRDEQILLIESQPPVKCFKIKYFEERIFKKRLLPKIDIPVQEPYMPDHSRNKKGAGGGEEKKEDKAEIG
jgi:type IV secretion system protein VirD4